MEDYIKDIPIIKVFIKDRKYYLYDTYTNRIFRVTQKQYLELTQLLNLGLNDYIKLKKESKPYKDIIMLIDKGMLKPSFINKIEHPKTKYVKFLTNRYVNGITLQVTKNCNFNCRYCVIANKNNIGRNHEKVDMPWNIAKKSIDFLYDHSKDANVLTIAFYGGEPMLNYDLIVKVVEYAESRFYTKKIKFMMTINGSILTEYMIRFLIKHDFDISISLDGPANIQNRHRRFSESGNNTFDIVINNVNNIKKIDEKYIDNHVTFIPVVFRDENYQTLLDFFNELGKDETGIFKLDVSLNGIDYLYSGDINMNSDEHLGYDLQKTNQKLMSYYMDKTKIPSVWHHNGPCVPLNKILINTDGEINMCEKVEYMKIGDIHKGIDSNIAIDYLNIGKYTEDECKSCWALRFCDMCVMNCLDVENYTINAERKRENCKRIKDNTLSFFKRCLIYSDDFEHN